jgi:hypothetical protein
MNAAATLTEAIARICKLAESEEEFALKELPIMYCVYDKKLLYQFCLYLRTKIQTSVSEQVIPNRCQSAT